MIRSAKKFAEVVSAVEFESVGFEFEFEFEMGGGVKLRSRDWSVYDRNLGSCKVVLKMGVEEEVVVVVVMAVVVVAAAVFVFVVVKNDETTQQQKATQQLKRKKKDYPIYTFGVSNNCV